MTPQDISHQLERIASADDFVWETYNLTDAWTKAGVGVEAVEPVLRFMEDHPDIHYGAPGPLVHFIEHLGDPEYENKLVASLLRQPTSHTAWLLNRCINSAKTFDQREHLLSVMDRARENPLADELTLEELNHFLKFQREENPWHGE